MHRMGMSIVLAAALSSSGAAVQVEMTAAEVLAARSSAEAERGAGKRGWLPYEAERNQYFPAQNMARVQEIAKMLPPKAVAAGAPKYHRAEWDALAATPNGQKRIAEAEAMLAEPTPRVPPESFDEYTKTGDRGVYSNPKGKVDRGLAVLVYGEALEGKGRFVPKIAEYIESMCSDPSWVAPYEGGSHDRNKPLHGDHYIDLTASRTAVIVATAISWFRDVLPADTYERAQDVLRGRIFGTFLKDARRHGETTPYLNWWMPDRFNWSAVCHNGCTSAILAVEDDVTVRAEAIEATERLMAPCFLSGFLSDGYCEEGMGYWNFGFGNFMQIAANIRAATKGGVDFCRQFPLARRIAEFGSKYRQNEKLSPPFADGNGTPAVSLLGFINQAWPELYAAEVSGLGELSGEFWVDGYRSFGEFKQVKPPQTAKAPLPLRNWFEAAGVLIARHGQFSMAAKGGYNGDRHNHNDAGSYVIAVGSEEYAGDPGNENYTGRTFSRRRYESKVLNSYAHPVPMVGGELQGTGPAFGAKVLETSFSDERDVIVYDLADAYPAKVPVVRLKRTIVFDRVKDMMTVTDEAEFAAPTAFESPVIAWSKPQYSNVKERFTLSSPRNSQVLTVSVSVEGGAWGIREEKIENPARVEPYRVAISMQEPVMSGKITVAYQMGAPSRVEEPVVVPSGAKYLDELNFSLAECGAGRRPCPKCSVDGKPMAVAGKSFARGVGVHAPFLYKIFANGALTRFVANVGVDDEVKETPKASVCFRVSADGKTLFDSGTLRSGDRAAVDVDLTGAKWVTLEAVAMEAGAAFDHADWADAAFVAVPGKDWGDTALASLTTQLGVLTPSESLSPRVNGPSVFGVTPGKPVIYYVPVTGEKPMTIAIDGIEKVPGLKFDPKTRMLSGVVEKSGDYPLTIRAENARGKASKKFLLRVGDRICLTPPLGWNSWNCWGQEVSDDKIRRAADAMANTGLRDHGWSYIVVDDCWRTRPTEKEAGFERPGWIANPDYIYGPARLEDGTPISNSHFPDMKAMADYIHSKGLKAGLYSVPGTVSCCFTFGSWNNEEKDAETWSAWGYDLVKYDWCYSDREYADKTTNSAWQFKGYKKMGDLLKRQPRDIVYNVCNYGRFDVLKWAHDAGGHYWRTNDDLKDEWRLLIRSIDENLEVADYAGPDKGWNDPDMLVIGPMRSNGYTHSRLTPNEQYAHMTLWAMIGSPLFIGCDLERLDKDPLAKALLTNDEVIEIDQDALGVCGRPVIHTDEYDVWFRPLDGGDWAVALFNRTWEDLEIKADFAELGLPRTCRVRCVWSQKDLGEYTDSFSRSIPGHAALLYRLSKSEKQ